MLGFFVFLFVVVPLVVGFVWLIKRPAISNQPIVDITDGDGNFSLEVVGEYYNQDKASVLQNRKEQIRFGRFILLPENTNRHDKNAVAVVLDGDIVGHLSRENAVHYRRKYGTAKTSVLGIVQGGRVNNSLWLDADFGLQEEQSVFHQGSVRQSFPVTAKKLAKYGANLTNVLNGAVARMVEVEVLRNEDGKLILVRVEGLAIGEIDANDFALLSANGAAAKTMAMIMASGSRWTVRLWLKPARA